MSNILATAAAGFNSRLSRAYSMIYRFLLSSRSRRRSPLPAGICTEKLLQLSQSCDCLKWVWVSSYIPVFFPAMIKFLKWLKMCQHLTAGAQAGRFVGFALRTCGFSGPHILPWMPGIVLLSPVVRRGTETLVRGRPHGCISFFVAFETEWWWFQDEENISFYK